MLKVGLRGVFSRKLRAFLTALAVFLGVALMTGTYVLTDTFTNSFGQIFEESNVGTDVAVVPREAIDSEQGADPPGMPERLLKEVRKVDGVLEATGGIFAAGVSLIDEDGDRIGSTQAPAFGASVQPKRFDPFDYAEGRPPEAADEVAVDKLSADREDLAVGDQITVAGNEAARQYEIVGIATLGEVDSFGGRDGGDPAAERGAAPGRQGGRVRPDLDRGQGGRRSRSSSSGASPRSCRPASRCAPARRTRSSRPTTSRTTSASSRSRS